MSSSHASQAQSLAEIPETGAPSPVAALYGDIRTTLGVDLVNLVYRHLATVPGALAWAWTNLGPHFRSGAIDAQAQALRDRVREATAAWVPAFDGVAGTGPACTAAAALARAYNLNNSRNMVAFQHLLRADAGTFGTPATAATAPAATPRLPPLPPIPAWSDIRPADRDTVMRLNRLGEPSEPAIVASLYRHLALWPQLLDAVQPALVQLDARGALAQALAHTLHAAQSIARAAPLAMPHPAPAAVDAALRARLRVFADVTIPKMVPVGLALEAAFGGRL